MGWFTRTAVAMNAAQDMDAADSPAPSRAASSILPTHPVAASTIGLGSIPGLVGGWMSRDTACLVPAFARGLEVIASVGSAFPLLEYDQAGNPLQGQGFTAQSRRANYEQGVPTVTTMRVTLADLVCEGRAYWYKTTPATIPDHVVRLDPTRVGKAEDGSWLVDGNPYPADRIIEFSNGTPGSLASGWYTLQTAISLEAAANHYALSPMPQIALKSVGIDLDDEEITQLLDRWETARRSRGTAYLNSVVDTKEYGWSSGELQLVEARGHAAVEVSRVLNLNPYWVGANTSGSSLTYTNRQDIYQELLDMTILPLLRVIEQRLTMLTVNQDRVYRFDTTAFLRANLGDRVSAFTSYIAAGVMTVDEARALEPMIRNGAIPQ